MIRNFDFKAGALVLIRNTAIEKVLNRKMRPCYLGPLLVVLRNKGGAYIVCELDGTLYHNPVTAYRIIPYLMQEYCLTSRNIPTSQSSSFVKWNEVLQKIQRIQQYIQQAATKSWTWPTGKRLAMSWTTTTPSMSLTPSTLSPDIDLASHRRPGDADARGTDHC
jgi:hypothetical protein